MVWCESGYYYSYKYVCNNVTHKCWYEDTCEENYTYYYLALRTLQFISILIFAYYTYITCRR